MSVYDKESCCWPVILLHVLTKLVKFTFVPHIKFYVATGKDRGHRAGYGYEVSVFVDCVVEKERIISQDQWGKNPGLSSPAT